MHDMRFGPRIEDAGIRFRFWAPKHESIELKLEDVEDAIPMQARPDGWHEVVTDTARPGSLYRFVLPDGLNVPDPASRFQPSDVHGPSEVIDPNAHAWRDGDWRGRPWEECVLYELHVGAFTPSGTFRAAIERLDHLVSLGVTAIELMPIADFPGERNWGYDGTLLFAPDSSYGRPEDLKALVEAAHARDLMVFLDVIYNHFGPDGNYLPTYAPIFTERHHTPWGAAVNYDSEGSEIIRELVIQNALYWIGEYNVDGLRLDAVHAIVDDSARHLLEELAGRVRAAFPDRHIHLVLENEENQASRLRRGADGRPVHYTAQWNDDIHHVLHTAATGEEAGYYAEYAGDVEKLGRAVAEGFAFQGQMMTYRGEARGEPSGFLPPTAFVAFLQNHDQVGNRAFGDRITANARPEAVRAAAAIYLLAPQIPMLFMGEEWAAAQPFPFFCDFGPDLAEAVRNGRRAEFAPFPEFQDEAARERIPDPTARETFLSAKLAWDDAGKAPHAEWLAWYRKILAVRRAEVMPLLPRIGRAGTFRTLPPLGAAVEWRTADGARLSLAANLSDAAIEACLPSGREIWREGGEHADGRLAPWQVIWTID